jgi:hypothetical protein
VSQKIAFLVLNINPMEVIGADCNTVSINTVDFKVLSKKLKVNLEILNLKKLKV